MAPLAAAIAAQASNQATPAGALSFVSCWPEGKLRAAARELERLVQAGRRKEAVLQAADMAAQVSDVAGLGLGEALPTPHGRAHDVVTLTVLGVSSGRALRFRAVAERARRNEAVSDEEMLFALHVVTELAFVVAGLPT